MADASQTICNYSRIPDGFPEMLRFDVDHRSGTALVFANGDNTRASRATLTADSSAKMTVTWSEAAVDRAGKQGKLEFRATHFRRNNKGLVTVRAGGYTNAWRIEGACQRVEN